MLLSFIYVIDAADVLQRSGPSDREYMILWRTQVMSREQKKYTEQIKRHAREQLPAAKSILYSIIK